MQILPQRNSNLRELPVAPGNTNVNSARPTSAPASNIRPVAKATQGVRPGQNVRPLPGGGRGRGQVVARAAPQPGAAGRTVVRKEIPSTPSNTAPQVSFLALRVQQRSWGKIYALVDIFPAEIFLSLFTNGKKHVRGVDGTQSSI